MNRLGISDTRVVNLDDVSQIERMGDATVVRWSNGEREVVVGEPGRLLWEAYCEHYNE